MMSIENPFFIPSSPFYMSSTEETMLEVLKDKSSARPFDVAQKIRVLDL
jgi:hypothetical protein